MFSVAGACSYSSSSPSSRPPNVDILRLSVVVDHSDRLSSHHAPATRFPAQIVRGVPDLPGSRPAADDPGRGGDRPAQPARAGAGAVMSFAPTVLGVHPERRMKSLVSMYWNYIQR